MRNGKTAKKERVRLCGRIKTIVNPFLQNAGELRQPSTSGLAGSRARKAFCNEIVTLWRMI
jgi:hypothetical protein